ncbi:MAG: two pore domain potassium channel family protein [Gammaproteobacteria bacterium]|nr:two pore domain potassium channel family protein [Gammaproteobacteria bacterium]
MITVVIHAGGMYLVMQKILRQDGPFRQQWQIHIYVVGITILLMFIVSLLEVLVWAVAFLALDTLQNFDEALYFSMVTFTTLGYGDVLLHDRWRLLSSFEAANGIIMFGWTTAIVIAVVQRVYSNDKNVK